MLRRPTVPEDHPSEAEYREFEVPGPAAGERLDRFLSGQLPECSRARIQALIKSGKARVNGSAAAKPRAPLRPGDHVVLEIPPPEIETILPEAIPLDVLFEDDRLIVIDKPAGIVVHPGAGNRTGALCHALMHHCRGRLSTLSGADRPGIVHRLDRDTSGCLVAAKDDETHAALTALFAGREVEKIYFCVVQGVPRVPSGLIENRIGRHPVRRQRMAVLEAPAGKTAVTAYEVVHADPAGAWSLVRCRLHTGRTHQIRVHMKESLLCPILGDEVYAQPARQSVRPGRLMLHARWLGFTHPATGARMRFESPLPEAFRPFLGDSGGE